MMPNAMSNLMFKVNNEYRKTLARDKLRSLLYAC